MGFTERMCPRFGEFNYCTCFPPLFDLVCKIVITGGACTFVDAQTLSKCSTELLNWPPAPVANNNTIANGKAPHAEQNGTKHKGSDTDDVHNKIAIF